MDIGIFGATGVIGSRAVAEATQRGHRVTAFSRDAARFPAEQGQVAWQVADWLDADSIAGGDGDISAEDLAVALLDEVEQPRFLQRRFTVGY